MAEETLISVRERRFQAWFQNWCNEEGNTIYDEPENQIGQMEDAWTNGGFTNQEMFLALRDMPETDRINFFRMQLQIKPIPVDVVAGKETRITVARPVTEDMLDYAALGWLNIHNDVDNPIYDDADVLHVSPIMDTTKGFTVRAWVRGEQNPKYVASFTYERMLVYAATGMLDVIANNFNPISGCKEPAEFLSDFIHAAHGGRTPEEFFNGR